MTLRRTFVHRFAILYLSLPTVCFLLFWVRPVVGIIAASLLVFAVVRLFRGAGDCTELDRMMPSCETIRIPPFACMTLVTVLFVWCILTGQGGVVPQSSDWHWRNALFRDLITHRWPVVYPEWDRALVFYCGHWLPAACATKLIVALGMNLELSWHVGNVFLLVWTYSGVLIVFLQKGAGDIATNFGLNESFSDILTGIILFFIIGSEFFIFYKVSFRHGGSAHGEVKA